MEWEKWYKMLQNGAGKCVYRALLRYKWNKETNKEGNKKELYLLAGDPQVQQSEFQNKSSKFWMIP